MTEKPKVAEGLGVDSSGNPTVDPSENVKALMEASLASVGALREADKELVDEKIRHLEKIGELRAQHADQLRTSDLKAADKTREVDVLAGAASAAALATAVSALQATSDRNAETLRNQVAGSATTMAKQTADAATAAQLQVDNLFRRADERIAALERAAATGAGRQSVVDPQMDVLITKMDKIVSAQSQGSGRGEGDAAAKASARATVVMVVGIATILIGVVSFFLKFGLK